MLTMTAQKSHDHGRDWEALYREQAVEEMPWYRAGLDPDFERALEALGIESGRTLDIGTGPGTQAIALAKMGLEVTASDVSQTAIDKAAARAREQGLKIDFIQDDILHSHLTGTFDYVFDRGLFHSLPPDERGSYVGKVSGLIAPGGYLFLKCFSKKEPPGPGPHRLSPDEIEDNFSGSFEIISIEDSVFDGEGRTFRLALFAVMRKIGER